MRVDLATAQFNEVDRGRLTGPDGTTYARRTTRAKRRACDEAIAQGSPLVLYYWAGHQLDWLDGPDAQSEWTRIRADVTTTPRPRGNLEWTAGFWHADPNHSILVLTGHC